MNQLLESSTHARNTISSSSGTDETSPTSVTASETPLFRLNSTWDVDRCVQVVTKDISLAIRKGMSDEAIVESVRQMWGSYVRGNLKYRNLRGKPAQQKFRTELFIRDISESLKMSHVDEDCRRALLAGDEITLGTVKIAIDNNNTVRFSTAPTATKFSQSEDLRALVYGMFYYPTVPNSAYVWPLSAYITENSSSPHFIQTMLAQQKNTTGRMIIRIRLQEARELADLVRGLRGLPTSTELEAQTLASKTKVAKVVAVNASELQRLIAKIGRVQKSLLEGKERITSLEQESALLEIEIEQASRINRLLQPKITQLKNGAPICESEILQLEIKSNTRDQKINARASQKDDIRGLPDDENLLKQELTNLEEEFRGINKQLAPIEKQYSVLRATVIRLRGNNTALISLGLSILHERQREASKKTERGGPDINASASSKIEVQTKLEPSGIDAPKKCADGNMVIIWKIAGKLQTIRLPKDFQGLEKWAEEYLPSSVVLTRFSVHAAQKSNFLDIPFVYQALLLAVSYTEMREQNGPTKDYFKEQRKRLRLEYGPSATPQILQERKNEYTVIHNGVDYLCNKKFARSDVRDPQRTFRMYFAYDKAARRTIIGSIPRHLSNRLD